MVPLCAAAPAVEAVLAYDAITEPRKLLSGLAPAPAR